MTSVVLENVSVEFPIYGAQQRSLRSALFERATGGLIERGGKHQERVIVKALTDVSLTFEDGDRIGLVGHNGSGKSTLLKLLAGIYEPVAGRLEIRGRVTPLFDVMPGLDPEDTGYENIITSGLLIGLSRQEIEAKIPEIEEASELGEYLTLPVRTYSLGMSMRLGFALVTALDPDVLLMDEGFGTGDLRFAERAQARMDQFIGRSRVMILASHSDATIRAMCNKAVMMESGKVVAVGPVNEVCDQYYESVHGDLALTRSKERKRNDEAEATAAREARARVEFSDKSIREVGLYDRLKRTSGAVRMTRFVAVDPEGRPKWRYTPNETVSLVLTYEVLSPVTDMVLLIRLIRADGMEAEHIVCEIIEQISQADLSAGEEGTIEITFELPPLVPNDYQPYVWLGRIDRSECYDVLDSNVKLPAIAVNSATGENDLRRGILALDYSVRNKKAVCAEKIAQADERVRF